MNYQEKIDKLKKELEEYKKKLAGLKVHWGSTRGESRYGDEYVEIQIKVYENFIMNTQQEIIRVKKLMLK